MKKKMGQIGVVTLLLVLLTAFMGVMASAEEGGYWTEQLDEEGRVVRIFTYTEPVDITENEGEPMDDADYAAPEEPAAEMVQAPSIWRARTPPRLPPPSRRPALPPAWSSSAW